MTSLVNCPAIAMAGHTFFLTVGCGRVRGMRISMEGTSEQPVESVREQHERAAARAIAEEFHALSARADERVRSDPVYQRVSQSLESF